MRYRTKKLLVIPKEHTEDLTKENLRGIEAYNNQIVIVEPLSFKGYNFILTKDSRIFRVPQSWLIIKPKKLKGKDMFKKYKREQIGELRPVTPEEIATKTLDAKISLSKADADNGSPLEGDMIARNPNNHEDQWLVAKQYFEDNFSPSTDEAFGNRLFR